MVTTCYSMYLLSSVSKIKKEVKKIMEFLKAEIPNLTEEDLFDIRVIYSELIANAIIHGNKNNAKKKVDLFIEVNECQIESLIKDEGNGFDYSLWLNRDKLNDSYLSIFCERGRGLRLVQYLTDSISFNEKGNEVTFIKNLEAAND